MKPEVHHVTVIIHLPSRRMPEGQVAYGHYIVVDGLLTMVGPDGEPAIDETGKTYTHKLAPGDDAGEIAGRLTKELRSALQRKSNAPGGFGGPLNYPSKGWL